MTEIIEQQQWTVGQVITSADDYVAMPVGTQIRGVYLWEKQGDGRWHPADGGNRYPLVAPSTEGGVRVVRIGFDTAEASAEASANIQIGTSLTSHEQFDTLPEGAVIRRRAAWTKNAAGEWVAGNGRRLSSPQMDGSFVIIGLPGEETPRLGDFYVGMPITNRSIYENLPDGVQVQGNWRHEKRDGRWYRMRDSSERTSLNTDGSVFIAHIPADLITRAGLSVGDTLDTVEDFERLPIGTIIGPNEGEQWERVTTGFRNASDGDTVPVTGLSTGGYNRILSLPAMSGVPVQETLQQFKWRFRDGALASAHRNGITIAPVLEVMERLDCRVSDFGLVQGMKIRNLTDLNELQEGVSGYVGDPDTGSEFGLWRTKGSGRWDRIIGDSNVPGERPLTIHDGPGVEPSGWTSANGTAADKEAIDSFKALAWMIGVDYKYRYNWCAEFERTMEAVGIDASAAARVSFEGMVVGQTVDAEQARRLPEWSILRWQERGDWMYYYRDNSSDTPARTTALFGPTGGHWASRMEIIHIHRPEYGSALKIAHTNMEQVWDHLPIGTVLHAGGHAYVMHDGHRVRQVDARAIPASAADMLYAGQYGFSDFSRGTLFHVSRYGFVTVGGQ